MDQMTHTHPNATWCSDAARLRSHMFPCPTERGIEGGNKPAIEMVAFCATHQTRRGVPSP